MKRYKSKKKTLNRNMFLLDNGTIISLRLKNKRGKRKAINLYYSDIKLFEKIYNKKEKQ